MNLALSYLMLNGLYDNIISTNLLYTLDNYSEATAFAYKAFKVSHLTRRIKICVCEDRMFLIFNVLVKNKVISKTVWVI